MIITVKKSTTKQEIEQMLLKFQPRKLFHSQEFTGKIKWDEDALAYQKRLRDEWK